MYYIVSVFFQFSVEELDLYSTVVHVGPLLISFPNSSSELEGPNKASKWYWTHPSLSYIERMYVKGVLRSGIKSFYVIASAHCSTEELGLVGAEKEFPLFLGGKPCMYKCGPKFLHHQMVVSAPIFQFEQ